MTTGAPRRVLVLYWHPGPQPLRAAIAHHLRVLDAVSRPHKIVYFNAVHGAPAWLRRVPFDAIVLHTTLLCLRWSDSFANSRSKLRWIGDADVVKLALPQDEYDHAEVLDEWLGELGVTDVFTNFDEGMRAVLYPGMRSRATFHRCFTGYVDPGAVRRCAERLVPLGQRPWDIVYRATKLPYWFGSHGQLKHAIGSIVAERAKALGLRTDVSTRAEHAIVGDRWFDFLLSGRTVIGCESGSSVLDRRGEIRAHIKRLLRETPDMTFEEVGRRMPKGWDDHRFFALSPRHFEAVITRTGQILVEGHYDGVLQPQHHYLPLKRDFSNLDVVLQQARDVALLERMTATAYEDICASGKYGYDALARDIEGVVLRRSPNGARTGALFRLGGLVAAEAVTAWRDLPARGLMARLIRTPRTAAPRRLLALAHTLADVRLRRLLLLYMRDGACRRDIPLAGLLADLLRLSVLRRAGSAPGELGFRVTGAYDPDRAELRFRSVLVGSTVPTTGQSLPGGDSTVKSRLQLVVWDHSPIAEAVTYAGRGRSAVQISIGPQGTYQFAELVRLAERYPSEVWSALNVDGDAA